jgi:hypothetical protein
MTAREAEQIRRTKARLRIIQHYQQVTRNVSLTCSSESPAASFTSG